ncbi:MAG: uroporphyrinogen-III synthase [Pseudomonadota bacterium]
MTDHLKGIKVWVTRPKGRTQHLCDLIAASGGMAFGFPVLGIETLPESSIRAQFAEVKDIHGLIVVSGFAAQLGLPHLQHREPPNHVFAVGRSTKSIMDKLGFSNVQTPDDYTTEGLLGLPELTNVADQTWMIVKGVGGRSKLARELKQRGAQVTLVDVYKRKAVEQIPDAIVKNLKSGQINLVTVTSGDILSVILDQLEAIKSELTKIPMIVPSTRVESMVMDLLPGASVLRAKSATDEDMVSCMIDYASGKKRVHK